MAVNQEALPQLTLPRGSVPRFRYRSRVEQLRDAEWYRRYYEETRARLLHTMETIRREALAKEKLRDKDAAAANNFSRGTVVDPNSFFPVEGEPTAPRPHIPDPRLMQDKKDKSPLPTRPPPTKRPVVKGMEGPPVRVADAGALSETDRNILALTLLGEAGGEGYEGMLAVMHSINNRAMSGRWGSNLAAIAIQKNAAGVHQYSTWNTPELGGNNPAARFNARQPVYAQAVRAINAVLNGESVDPTQGATHYYAKGSTKPYWWSSEAPQGAIEIGQHVFGARYAVAPEPAVRSSAAAQTLGRAIAEQEHEAYAEMLVRMSPLDVNTLVQQRNSRVNPQDFRIYNPINPNAAPPPEMAVTVQAPQTLTTRKVRTVPIDPTTGMPYKPTEAARLNFMRTAERSFGRRPGTVEANTEYVLPNGQVLRQTAAGYVQMPPDYQPKIDIPELPDRTPTPGQVETATGFRLPEPRLPATGVAVNMPYAKPRRTTRRDQLIDTGQLRIRSASSPPPSPRPDPRRLLAPEPTPNAAGLVVDGVSKLLSGEIQPQFVMRLSPAEQTRRATEGAYRYYGQTAQTASGARMATNGYYYRPNPAGGWMRNDRAPLAPIAPSGPPTSAAGDSWGEWPEGWNMGGAGNPGSHHRR